MKNDLKVLVDDLPEVSTQIYTCFSGCEIAHFFGRHTGPTDRWCIMARFLSGCCARWAPSLPASCESESLGHDRLRLVGGPAHWQSRQAVPGTDAVTRT